MVIIFVVNIAMTSNEASSVVASESFSDTVPGMILTSTMFIIPMLFCFFGQPLVTFLGDRSKKHHASIGKRAMKIKVVNLDGTTPSTGQLFLRLLLKVIIPYEAVISMITILASEKHQALHDMMLSEVVVENK